jgi:hypothetical protein
VKREAGKEVVCVVPLAYLSPFILIRVVTVDVYKLERVMMMVWSGLSFRGEGGF